ncbi:acyl carrier protein [Sandaracinus amylolyticus]|uniref:acyl carrier protein n=1 Tax=Sandaracinus amylolyticus TaxID=927083 RepID=UPI001F2392BE|nr:acyl carrier protein [Sandaracinus amylolyticus]UJR84127.1 Hypothetical protein I5071_61980 [Sandaracinus amylolyticus]
MTHRGDALTTKERRTLTIALLAEILEADPATLRPHDRLRDDLGLDSLQSLELLSRLAEELRIDLPMEDALALRTVEDACCFVETTWSTQSAERARG